ncbi:hypothetical protein COO60DRAFT_1518387 [Scenedesmus sp. NREL 46B-D3]|nr:hypothetical protein COO60DRAFT_1518387 [Scenedesmus sp. NREL 46B-D3]
MPGVRRNKRAHRRRTASGSLTWIAALAAALLLMRYTMCLSSAVVLSGRMCVMNLVRLLSRWWPASLGVVPYTAKSTAYGTNVNK